MSSRPGLHRVNTTEGIPRTVKQSGGQKASSTRTSRGRMGALCSVLPRPPSGPTARPRLPLLMALMWRVQGVPEGAGILSAEASGCGRPGGQLISRLLLKDHAVCTPSARRLHAAARTRCPLDGLASLQRRLISANKRSSITPLPLRLL